MPTIGEVAELDLEAMCTSSPSGDVVVVEETELGEDFAPNRTRLMLWRRGKAASVLVPESVAYTGEDVRLAKCRVYDGWRLLHVGPADFRACVAEFGKLLDDTRAAPRRAPPRKKR